MPDYICTQVVETTGGGNIPITLSLNLPGIQAGDFVVLSFYANGAFIPYNPPPFDLDDTGLWSSGTVIFSDTLESLSFTPTYIAQGMCGTPTPRQQMGLAIPYIYEHSGDDTWTVTWDFPTGEGIGPRAGITVYLSAAVYRVPGGFFYGSGGSGIDATFSGEGFGFDLCNPPASLDGPGFSFPITILPWLSVAALSPGSGAPAEAYTERGSGILWDIETPVGPDVPLTPASVSGALFLFTVPMSVPSPPPLLTVACPSIQVVIGVAYDSFVVATGGIPPYVNYALHSGALPPGLNLNAATGEITGVPTTPGTFFPVFRVTDSSAATADTLGCPMFASAVVVACPAGATEVGVPYDSFVVASGGMLPYTAYGVAFGPLPPGLAIDPLTGEITGTPTTPGTYTPTFAVGDSTPSVGLSPGCPIVVSAALSVSCPADVAVAGANYSSFVTITGGVGPFTWALNSGALPLGLSLNAATGEIAGVPGVLGTYTPVFAVTDSLGAVALSPGCPIVVSAAGGPGGGGGAGGTVGGLGGIAGLVGGPQRFIKCCANGHVFQLARMLDAVRYAEIRKQAWPYIHEFPPPGSDEVNQIASIPSPAVATITPVLLYQVPEGLRFFLAAILQDFEGAAFDPSDALWTVDRDAQLPNVQGQVVQGLQGVPVPLGSAARGVLWRLPRAYEFPPLTVLRSTVVNQNLGRRASKQLCFGLLWMALASGFSSVIHFHSQIPSFLTHTGPGIRKQKGGASLES